MSSEEVTERNVYRCYYCKYEGEGEECFWHTESTHSNQVLKLRKQELNSQNGKLGFRTLNYHVIPDIIKKTNKSLYPEFSNGQIYVRIVDASAENDFGISNLSLDDISPDSPLAKNMRTSTPHKVASVVCHEHSANESKSLIDDDIYFARKCNESDDMVIEGVENSMTEENERLVAEIESCLPDVVDSLKECGQLENWIQFHHLIKEGSFPLDNIAFHLFMDVCRFYSLSSTSGMRYNPVVKRFWRIGYCLFHGKFLNFMSGPKNTGDKLDNPNESLNPKNAKINFAVPFQSIRKSKSEESFTPGILHDIVDKLADQSSEKKTYKLCVDGKKINAGRSIKSGDIDLFGFEQSPTLSQRKERLNEELLTVQNLNDKLIDLEIKRRTNPYTFPDNDKTEVRSMLQKTILHISNRIRDLRKTKVNKSSVLEKLKKNGGPDWRKSKFMYVISSLQTDLYDISVIIEDLLKSVSELGNAVAVINGTSHLYTDEKTVNLEFQENFVHLSDGFSSENCSTEPRHIRQGSEEWQNVRSTAKVTGSTLHKTVGLGTLKQQQDHFDSVIFKKERESPTIATQERMKYGSENEINAISTLVSKIIHVYEPTLSYIEEGCCKYSTCAKQVPIVVSPDGSLRNSVDDKASFGVECKCPFPGKTYTTPVYYQLPKYYVTQVLSEMVALDTNKLYFICYSEESSTVFTITHSDDLWKDIEQEVDEIYGGKTAVRPTRRSPEIKELQDKIDRFCIENVTFIAEVPSVKAEKCKHSTDVLYCSHIRQQGSTKKVYSIKEVQECIRRCETTINRAYQLSRTKASEFLGFMISDTDRQSNPESCHAIPIAYGLKGYSLPAKTLREMIEYVINVCSQKGLYTPVCSFDGQWCKMAVRDRDDHPLTLLQLQKDVYTFVKKMSKNDIVKNICEVNMIKCQDNILPESVKLERTWNCLTVGNGNKAYRLITTCNIAKMIMSKETTKADNNHALEENDNIEIVKEIIGSLNTASNDNIDEQVVNDAINVASSVDNDLDFDDNVNNPDENATDSLGVLFKETGIENETNNQINLETIQPNRQLMNIRNDVTESSFLSSLNSAENVHAMLKMFNERNPDTSLDETILNEKLKDANSVNKSFTKNQLIILLTPLLPILKANKVKCNVSQPKYVFANLLSNIFGDGSHIQSRVRVKKTPSSLVSLCKKAVHKLPKVALNSVYANHIYPEKIEQWQNETPFGYKICIHEISEIMPSYWYSIPEYNNVLNNYLFVILDAYHQICGLRRLFCSSGIPAAGVYSKPMHIVAENSDFNGSDLSIAIVKDLIDKQSIAYAVQTFSEKVQMCLRDINAYNEAEFCELVRNWYRAEDEPGMAAIERYKHRLKFRQWLLKDVRFDEFPPYGSYVKDIPIVLFEGLILGIERKIQLYSFTRTGTYNTRSIGSLDIENFFSTFQDLDPRGTGVLRPDDIPSAVGIAMELLDARLDPDRGFFMQTSKKRVYPTNELESECELMEHCSEFNQTIRDVSVITVRDHAFDKSERSRGKQKRKSGRVSKNFEPAKNPVPVREYHRTCESKILPHVRRGLKLDF